MPEKPSTLRIQITTGHCLGGEGHDVVAGTILEAPTEISVEDALRKVRIGYAVVVPAAPSGGPAGGTPPIMTSDPTVAHRDPETEGSALPSRPGRRTR